MLLIILLLLILSLNGAIIKLQGLTNSDGSTNTNIGIYRSLMFYNNNIKVESFNKRKNNRYKKGINPRFCYMSEEQFNEQYLSKFHRHNEHQIQFSSRVQYNNTNRMKNDKFYQDYKVMLNISVPIDYRKQGMVSPIKTQGSCGGCYAFSITSIIQSGYLLKNKTVILSEQQLLDCTIKYNLKGCDGGSFVNGLIYTIDFGLYSIHDYPFVGKIEQCKKPNATKFKIANGYLINNYYPNQTQAEYGGCADVYRSLQKSPVATGVMASSDWMFYQSGIYDACSGYLQGNNDVNHAVVIVGYQPATRNGPGYWIAKNSWGTLWGEQGFIRISTQKTITPCNICFYNVFAEV